jgi:hypothetical protein
MMGVCLIGPRPISRMDEKRFFSSWIFKNICVISNFAAMWMAVGPRCHTTRHLRIVPGATVTPANVVDTAVRIGTFSKKL